jgi:predicted GIY-YIG superfamily endonuclease
MAGFNDLATTHPKIAKQAYGWDPKRVFAGSTSLKLKWQCSVNSLHIWVTTPSSRTGQNSGCPTCAEYGYSQIKPGYLYFLRHPDWLMYQIGITNTPRKRLAQHANRGWEVIEYLGPMSGTKALQLETKILRMLRQNGADLMNWRIAGKFDGYSESWTIKSFSSQSLDSLIKSSKKY